MCCTYKHVYILILVVCHSMIEEMGNPQVIYQKVHMYRHHIETQSYVPYYVHVPTSDVPSQPV